MNRKLAHLTFLNCFQATNILFQMLKKKKTKYLRHHSCHFTFNSQIIRDLYFKHKMKNPVCYVVVVIAMLCCTLWYFINNSCHNANYIIKICFNLILNFVSIAMLSAFKMKILVEYSPLLLLFFETFLLSIDVHLHILQWPFFLYIYTHICMHVRQYNITHTHTRTHI